MYGKRHNLNLTALIDTGAEGNWMFDSCAEELGLSSIDSEGNSRINSSTATLSGIGGEEVKIQGAVVCSIAILNEENILEAILFNLFYSAARQVILGYNTGPSAVSFCQQPA
jgi:hypothetical protein